MCVCVPTFCRHSGGHDNGLESSDYTWQVIAKRFVDTKRTHPVGLDEHIATHNYECVIVRRRLFLFFFFSFFYKYRIYYFEYVHSVGASCRFSLRPSVPSCFGLFNLYVVLLTDTMIVIDGIITMV